LKRSDAFLLLTVAAILNPFGYRSITTSAEQVQDVGRRTTWLTLRILL